MGLCWSGRWLSKAESLQIAIAKPVQGELATADGLEELTVIRREGLQSAHTPTVPIRGLAKSVQHFLERGVLIDAGQGIQVAFSRLAGHFGAAVEVGDAPP